MTRESLRAPFILAAAVWLVAGSSTALAANVHVDRGLFCAHELADVDPSHNCSGVLITHGGAPSPTTWNRLYGMCCDSKPLMLPFEVDVHCTSRPAVLALAHCPTAENVVASVAPNDVSMLAKPRTFSMRGHDEFRPPESSPDIAPKCFTQEPMCQANLNSSGVVPCRQLLSDADFQRVKTRMSHLNKCMWSPIHAASYWQNKDEPTYHFDAREVRVANGELIMEGSRNPAFAWPSGNLTSALANSGCFHQDGRQGAPPGCPFRAGGVMSRVYDRVSQSWWDDLGNAPKPPTGFSHKYGRLEVRGRLAWQPGSYDAFWMVPQTTDYTEHYWPRGGELDVMEGRPDQVFQTLHLGSYCAPGLVCPQVQGPVHAAKGFLTFFQPSGQANIATPSTAFSRPHVYAVEWDEKTVRFSMDNRVFGEIREGDPAPFTTSAGTTATWPAYAPRTEFWWILSHSVLREGWVGPSGDWDPLGSKARYNAFPEDLSDTPNAPGYDAGALASYRQRSTRVDYMRSYVQCATGADACPYGGTFDGANCRLGNVSAAAATRAFTERNAFYYWAVKGAVACPFGGTLGVLPGTVDSKVCKLGQAHPLARPFVYGDGLYYENTCVESTVADTCQRPCAGIGQFDGYHCLVGEAPAGTWPAVTADKKAFFYYAQDAITPFSAVPSGRLPFTTGRGFYLDPVCRPDEVTPACAEPCPPDYLYAGDGACQSRDWPVPKRVRALCGDADWGDLGDLEIE